MAEIKTTKNVPGKTHQQLMGEADTTFLPNIPLIDAIFQAYEGSRELTEEAAAADPLRTGAGGSIYFVTELLTSLIARDIKLNPPKEYYIKKNKDVPDPMNDQVIEIIEDYMLPRAQFARPKWGQHWDQSVRHGLLSGGFGFFRWLPTVEWQDAQEQMMYTEEGPGIVMGEGGPARCETVIQRLWKNFCINRDYQTGLPLEAPYWFKIDISESYTATDYIYGPLHHRQVVSAIINKQTQTDYYGMSYFAPIFTELKNAGKAYEAAQAISRDLIWPATVIHTLPGLPENEKSNIDTFLDTLNASQDITKYRKSYRVPGGTKIEQLYPNLRYDDIAKFEQYLQEQILTWLRIPLTLVLPKSNYAVSKIQYELFNQLIDKLRNTFWEGWESTHFRPLLLENGVEDWETTPINVGWDEYRIEWEEENPKLITERLEDFQSSLEKTPEQIVEDRKGPDALFGGV